MSLAVVFPGQGSQSVGMLAGLAAVYAGVRETFDEASEALGFDLWQLVQDGPAQTLNETDKTQPVMLAAGVATWRLWCVRGGAKPVLLAGHSLGEYTALVCAGALSLRDAVSLVAARGRYMQEAVPLGAGAMAAVLGLTDEEVITLCHEAASGQVLEAVNFNSPGQVVVAGEAEAVDRAIALAKEAGAKRAVKLPVSVPSHCTLMQPAARRLAERLAEVSVSPPAVPVIHNADVAAHDNPAAIRDALVRQLHSPVRWAETVRCFASQGVTAVVECGPGKVLAGLNRRTDRRMAVWAVHDPASLDTALLETRKC
ncbi:MAG TPA: [acyl-carrier-protein] S-malonyltransferase [Gammaproteobacteria bacterium]|nr:[acyl-carrier-protein] S-malonyltransferase [Gammaproteobacteria bacterium]